MRKYPQPVPNHLAQAAAAHRGQFIMRKRMASVVSLAVLSFGALAGADGLAQTTGGADQQAANGPVSDVVVVTGNVGQGKHTKTQTSYSITTIGEEALRLQAPTSVTEAVKSVPGFWVESSGGEASGNIRARGIPVDGYGSVTLLEDGIPVQHDPSLGYLNADQAFRLDETIDGIEVVRGGPSSVVYSNAPAGAINFRSRDIGKAPNGIAKLSVGDYGLRRGDLWYATPLANGWGIGVGGFYREDNGIRSPGFKANEGGQARIKITKDIDHGNIMVDVKHMDDKVNLLLGIPMMVSGGKLVAVPGFDGNFGTIAGPETRNVDLKTGSNGAYHFDNSEGTHVKRDQFTFKLEKDLGDWHLTEGLRLSKTDTVRNGVFPNQLIGFGAFLSGAQPLLKWVPGATQLALQRTDAPGTAYTNPSGLMVVGGLRGIGMPLKEQVSDTKLGRKFVVGGQTHEVTAGYYHAHFTQGFQRYSSSALLGAESQAPLVDLVGLDASGKVLGSVTDHGIYSQGYEWANASGRSTTNAFYLSDEWQITPAFRLDGGVRRESVDTAGWTEESKKVNLGSFPLSNVLTGSGVIDHYDHSFSKTGWTVGANYQLSRTQGIFGRWTSAFRLPNLSSYITSPNATPITQTMGLGEMGYKYKNPFMEFYPTLFYSKYDNVSFTNNVFNLNNQTVTPQIGYATTRTYGLELDGRVTPNTMFDLGYTLTLQQPKYEGLLYNDNVSGQPVQRDFDGNALIRVPKVSYRLVPGVNIGEALRLQFSYEYEGKRFVDTANTVVLPAYHTINFTARYAINAALTAYFYVDNLNNSMGLTEGNPRAGEVVSADAGANAFIARPLLGRSIRAALTYQF
jgi:outer membrane receptor protein involved in Fe transport